MGRFLGILLVFVATVPLTGCNGGGGPETHPVTGKVTINGQPADGLQVTFNPVEPGKEAASGNVGPDGKYTLYTGIQGKEGAPAGKYKITFSDPSDSSYMDPGASGDPTKSASGRVPAEYRTASSSPKEVEVTAGPNTIDIEIPQQ
jgi:hypothetical protein